MNRVVPSSQGMKHIVNTEAARTSKSLSSLQSLLMRIYALEEEQLHSTLEASSCISYLLLAKCTVAITSPNQNCPCTTLCYPTCFCKSGVTRSWKPHGTSSRRSTLRPTSSGEFPPFRSPPGTTTPNRLIVPSARRCTNNSRSLRRTRFPHSSPCIGEWDPPISITRRFPSCSTIVL